MPDHSGCLEGVASGLSGKTGEITVRDALGHRCLLSSVLTLFTSRPHGLTQAVDCSGGRPRSPMAAVPPAQGGDTNTGQHGDPDCSVSVRFGTHDEHCDGLW